MLRSASIACLTLMSAGAFAQSADLSPQVDPAAATAPIAFLYVTNIINPNTTYKHDVYAYSVAANGALTTLSGSPFNFDVTGLAATKPYLFALNNTTIDSYAIASTGSLHLVASNDAASHASGFCGGIGPLKTDHSGQDVYNAIADGDCEHFSFQNYGLNSTNGKLTYKSESPEVFLDGSELDFLGNNKFAYSPICTNFDHEEVGYIAGFQRASNGNLSSVALNNPGPTPKNTSNTYCPLTIATDPVNHLAVLQEEEDFSSDTFGTPVLATYTVDASGQLSTTSTYKNMPHTLAGSYVMRMSPSGKFLAVGGNGGLQIFHYNGANPATLYKTLLTGTSIGAMYWDNNNHLYALVPSDIGKGKLYIFTVTATSTAQAPGSPHAIPNPDGLIVHPN